MTKHGVKGAAGTIPLEIQLLYIKSNNYIIFDKKVQEGLSK